MKTDRIDRAKAETQATKAMGVITRSEIIKSVGTNRNYRDCLTAFAQFIKDNRLGDLRHSTQDIANSYLSARAEHLSQSSLNMHRQAIQAYFYAKGEMVIGEKLEIVKSEQKTTLEHRAYTKDQVDRVANAQNERNSFSTKLAYACGLRAHELLTIRKASEQPADIRRYEDNREKKLETKWVGRSGEIYTVVGKGGLIREVCVPKTLATELEKLRLNEARCITDREVHYSSYYDIAGGKNWSNSFSAASKRSLGWSTGAHGLRHSYAQERMKELQTVCNFNQALETVSQEMGHFREDITTVYLR